MVQKVHDKYPAGPPKTHQACAHVSMGTFKLWDLLPSFLFGTAFDAVPLSTYRPPPPPCVKSNFQSSGYISILVTHLARTRPGSWRETPVCPYLSASRRHLFPTYSHQRAVPHQLPSRHPAVGTDSLGPVPTATSTASPKRQIAEPTVDLASSADPTHPTFGLPKDTQPRFTFKPHYPQVIDRPAVWNPAHSHLLPEHIEISIYNNTPTPAFLGRVSPDPFKKIPSRCSLYTPKISTPTLATTCPIAPWQLPLSTQTTHPP